MRKWIARRLEKHYGIGEKGFKWHLKTCPRCICDKWISVHRGKKWGVNR